MSFTCIIMHLCLLHFLERFPSKFFVGFSPCTVYIFSLYYTAICLVRVILNLGWFQSYIMYSQEWFYLYVVGVIPPPFLLGGGGGCWKTLFKKYIVATKLFDLNLNERICLRPTIPLKHTGYCWIKRFCHPSQGPNKLTKK